MEETHTPAVSANSPDVHDGDLYLHVFNGNVLYIWLRVSKGGPHWEHVTEGVNHPTLAERVLYMRRDKKPSWILRESNQRYKRGQYHDHVYNSV